MKICYEIYKYTLFMYTVLHFFMNNKVNLPFKQFSSSSPDLQSRAPSHNFNFEMHVVSEHR